MAAVAPGSRPCSGTSTDSCRPQCMSPTSRWKTRRRSRRSAASCNSSPPHCRRCRRRRRRLILAIDEYELLDVKIGEGVFPVGLLATLRESIQTHRHMTWLFAGSHDIGELTHAPWSSYL